MENPSAACPVPQPQADFLHSLSQILSFCVSVAPEMESVGLSALGSNGAQDLSLVPHQSPGQHFCGHWECSKA